MRRTVLFLLLAAATLAVAAGKKKPKHPDEVRGELTQAIYAEHKPGDQESRL